MKQTACYVRVSTKDKQTTDSQRHVIRQWLASQRINSDGYKWYEDRETGTTLDRPALERLLKDVSKGKVQTVVVYKLDRLARNTRQGLQTLTDLASKQVRVVSVQQNIDWSGPMGQFLATIFLAVAEFERETIVGRIRDGIEARKAKGLHHGRPRNVERLNAIRAMSDSGMTPLEIARKMGCTRNNVYEALAKTRDLKVIRA